MPRFYCKLIISIFTISALALVLAAGDLCAQDIVKSKYFNVSIYDGISKTELLDKLHAGYFLQMDTALPLEDTKGKDTDAFLARALDSIYLNISDILDIHMYSFSIDVEILPDKLALSNELQKYLDKNIDVPSFYFYDKNTIYISYSDMTLGMLSHEIAHAIISHYFVVQPSVRIQEILSGYVEYSMKKAVK